MTDEKTFRIALLGCGRISKNHFEAIAKIDGLDLVAVCDNDATRAAEAGARWEVPHFTSYEKMLKEREERMKNNKGKKDGRRGGPGLP